MVEEFSSIPYWNNLQPEQKKTVTDYYSWAITTLQNPDGIDYIRRVFRRLFIFLSEDVEGSTKFEKLREQLRAQGYSASDAVADVTFLVGKKGVGVSAFKQVIEKLRTIAASNGKLAYRLQTLSFVTADKKRDLTSGELYQIVNDTLAEFTAMKNLKEGIPIKRFVDKAVWVDIQHKTCEIEGKLLHHCGNANPRPGDTIWSLRVPNSGDQLVPVATFIFNTTTKALGEMKGKFNKKPDPTYHKYIVGLLKDKNLVTKIDAQGGYLPENDFSLNDLSDSFLQQVTASNPELVISAIKSNRLGQTIPHQRLEKLNLSHIIDALPRPGHLGQPEELERLGAGEGDGLGGDEMD